VTAPKFGYSVPPAYAIHNRIPDDLPLVVRANRRNALLFAFGPALLALVVVMIVFAAKGLLTDVPAAVVAVAAACFLPLLLVSGAFRYLVLASGGPRLAAGPDGVWVRARKFPAKAIWLPWAAVERVYPRRVLFQTVICVKPRDPRLDSGYGALGKIQMGVDRAFLGTGFTTPGWNVDRPVPEIMSALAGFAGGRAAIG
jgi:hypothetical protein